VFSRVRSERKMASMEVRWERMVVQSEASRSEEKIEGVSLGPRRGRRHGGEGEVIWMPYSTQ
jgi:hypothetical protein